MASSQSWVEVDDEAAQASEWYGVGGWLMLFLVLYGLGGLWGVVENLQGARALLAYGSLLDAAYVVVAWVGLLVDVIVTIVLLSLVWQGFRKEPAFPDRFIGLLVVAFAAKVLHGLLLLAVCSLFDGAGRLFEALYGVPPHWGIWGGFVLGVALLGGLTWLQIWYFRASKRVNATYRNRLPAGAAGAPALVGSVAR